MRPSSFIKYNLPISVSFSPLSVTILFLFLPQHHQCTPLTEFAFSMPPIKVHKYHLTILATWPPPADTTRASAGEYHLGYLAKGNGEGMGGTVLRNDHIAIMGHRMYCNVCRKQLKAKICLKANLQGESLSMPTITSTLQNEPG